MIAYEKSGQTRPYIVVGDKTSKGGIVFTGSSIGSIAKKAIARVGDRATCGCNHCKKRGYTVITSGINIHKMDGLDVAREGDFTDCGAVLSRRVARTSL
ncbi:PAAR domain-containing protein [Roseateles koreensis]|uniref:PAAR domain-containing protein n=1 Tax=Roseateles koreensis TaxID=2987526 RepID=A0ABT5KRM4_9BURK|nr:PAAR domain-containing protein [Roseateles koreensis]MDC8785561.1 PAAR domain-containing protein [Roseateles koreensis]